MTHGQWPERNEQQGEQAGGDGRWQPPDRGYGQQPHEQENEQLGYAPGQYQPQPRFQPTQPFQPGPQPPLPPPRSRSWPARHKALTGIFAFAALIIIIVAANSGGSSSSPDGDTTTGLSTTPSATATAAPSRQAAPAAATTHKAHPKPTQTTSATSQAPAPPPPAPTKPAPATTTAAAVVAPPPPAAPAGCHPLTSGGNCYEPGEFCRNSDHNVSGVAGDGEAITCEDNNGWRWEPS